MKITVTVLILTALTSFGMIACDHLIEHKCWPIYQDFTMSQILAFKACGRR